MKHENRVTICLSSQVGCAMGCTFCATGTMGIRGNLSSGEILEQLVHGSRVLQRLHDDESLNTVKEEVNNKIVAEKDMICKLNEEMKTINISRARVSRN